MRLPRSPWCRPAALGLATVAVTVAVVLSGLPASAAPAEGDIRNFGGKTAVANSYIVVFKDAAVTSAAVGATASRLTGRFGGTVARTYRAALRGFQFTGSALAARRMAAHGAVKYVEQDHKVRTMETQPNPPSWGLDRVDQRDLPLNKSYTFPVRPADVRAYVIDTGVRTSHQTFRGRAVSGFDAVDGGTADDCHGHGTHVAGTAGGEEYGVAKGVQIVAVRVLGCDGTGTNAQVIGGIDWVTANGQRPAVANMSLGAPEVITVIDDAVKRSIAAGIPYAIAAGNGNPPGVRVDACRFSPARVPEAITVGATTITDGAATFSNFGSCVDILAPGQNIVSSVNTSDTATATASGTSMATPHVAGAAALILQQNPNFTPAQVRDALVNAATANKITNVGPNTPNRLLFVEDVRPPADDFSLSVSPAGGSTAPGGSVTATVSTETTAGSPQKVNLSASGLPSGVTASFDPQSVTSGGSSTMTLTTSAGTPPGTYSISVTGTGAAAARSATFQLTVTGDGGECVGTNGTNVNIPDAGAAVFSDIAVTCGRNGSATSKVEVHIVHTYRGDLVIDLIAPDGSAYRLKNSSFSDGSDNVDQTFTVNLAGEAGNGTWRLRVRDVFNVDVGFINSWTLTL